MKLRNLLVLLLSLVFSITCYAQIIHAGSSDDQFYSPANTCAASGSCAYTDNSVIPPTLRYGYAGQEIDYNIPASNGPGILELGFYEPNKTQVGQRVFTISINGSVVQTLDVYKLVGSKKYLVLPPFNVTVTDGFVHVAFKSVVANPLVSVLFYAPFITVGPIGPQGPARATGPQGMQGIPGPIGPQGPAGPTGTGGGTTSGISVPCAVPLQLPPNIYAQLSDGTCLPLVVIPPIGYIVTGNNWSWYADANNILHMQSFFSTFKTN